MEIMLLGLIWTGKLANPSLAQPTLNILSPSWKQVCFDREQRYCTQLSLRLSRDVVSAWEG